MHAPSGMTITDEHLYVVDRDGVYIIDIAKQKVSTFIPINDGSFLNDIARASNGDLYVSDFFGFEDFRFSGFLDVRVSDFLDLRFGIF